MQGMCKSANEFTNVAEASTKEGVLQFSISLLQSPAAAVGLSANLKP
jgi:hypothetical protein